MDHCLCWRSRCHAEPQESTSHTKNQKDDDNPADHREAGEGTIDIGHVEKVSK